MPNYMNNPKRTSRLYAERYNKPDHRRRIAGAQERDRVKLLKKMKKNVAAPMPVGEEARQQMIAKADKSTLKQFAKREGVRTFFRSKNKIRSDLMGKGRNG